MNIQKLISAVRQARKRRKINYFHKTPRSGIDVPDDEFNVTLVMLKTLFKYFKAQNCLINVSFYGEIIITLTEMGHSFELSITSRPHFLNIDAHLEQLKNVPYIKLTSYSPNNSMALSVRTIRPKALWKHYPIDINTLDNSLVERVFSDIKIKMNSYSTQDDDSSYTVIPSKNDILAAIHLGGAFLGRSSMLYHLSKSLMNRIYIREISITDNAISIDGSSDVDKSEHWFGKREADFFKQYLPGNCFKSSVGL